MSLDEIRVLLKFRDDPRSDCGDVNTLLDEHIDHVSRRVKELRVLEKQLKELRQRCKGGSDNDACGILTGLEEGAQDPLPSSKGHSHLRSVHTR